MRIPQQTNPMPTVQFKAKKPFCDNFDEMLLAKNESTEFSTAGYFEVENNFTSTTTNTYQRTQHSLDSVYDGSEQKGRVFERKEILNSPRERQSAITNFQLALKEDDIKKLTEYVNNNQETQSFTKTNIMPSGKIITGKEEISISEAETAFLKSKFIAFDDLKILTKLEHLAQNQAIHEGINSKDQKRDTEDIRILIKSIRYKFLTGLNTKLREYEKTLKLKDEKKVQKNIPNKSKLNETLKTVSAWGVIAGGLCLGFIDSFIGLSAMVGQIFTLVGATVVTPIISAVAASLSFVECCIFASFEAKVIKISMGVENKDNCIKLLNLDKAELNALNEFDGNLSTIKALEKKLEIQEKINKKVYQKEIYRISNLKKENYLTPIPKESIWKILGRNLLTGFASVITIAGAYFSMTSLLTAIGAAALIGTPVGWCIIGAGVFINLAMFLCIRAKGLTALFSPEINLYNTLKEETCSFVKNHREYKFLLNI